MSMKWPWLRFNVHHAALAAVVVLLLGVAVADWSAWLALPVCAVLVASVADGIARPASALFYPTITHGRRDDNRVALTFDDGPDAHTTPQLLDALAAAGAQATFFVIGRSLERQPELARRMIAAGHALGNHSWQHARTQNFRARCWQRREIERSEQALKLITGAAHAGLYRPPMGLKIGALCQELWRRQLLLVAWSLHSHDTRLDNPEQIAERVLKRVRGGDIILLHDGHDVPGGRRPHCVAAVKLILRGLERQGLRSVTVPELLAAGRSRHGRHCIESDVNEDDTMPRFPTGKRWRS